MLCLLLCSLFALWLLLLLGVGAILSIPTYNGGIYKKHPSRPWAVLRPGMRTAYYAKEEDARRDAAENWQDGGRGEVRRE